ncbi:DUF421 domain-containing protein [Brevibacillus ruminantium]|uniref:DUF421 domain-containing protein n=1 Tax=Brevibacillus ruminantium TaxID=2950604 RepID=A0ABY4WCR7_9BACL|nr:YetF domain-containing protein [Brevibacillus ruminantium]USG64544.1 DUF421 domain-containing protein [Brevibacillus ruminantium]
MEFIYEAILVLMVGYLLIRIAGKKTVSEMTGLEIITLLAVASMVSHAISGDGLWKTIASLCIFVGVLVSIQYLSIKSNLVEKLMMGFATPVIKDGQILIPNLIKLRMSVDQLEGKLREKGVTSLSDIKTATIEMSGNIGFELMRHAKPVTIGELEKILAQYQITPLEVGLEPGQTQKKPDVPALLAQSPQAPEEWGNLFTEVVESGHRNPIPPKLQ